MTQPTRDTPATIVVLDIAIRSHRRRQLAAEARGADVIAGFWADSVNALLEERHTAATEGECHA